MSTLGRPTLHALVGLYEEPIGLIGDGLIVTLEDAIDYQRLGFWVLVDPMEEADLATYERQQRMMLATRRVRT